MTDQSQPANPNAKPFWRKPLAEMSQPEWESLCDGCGRCCLVKLEDEDTAEVYFTSIGCKLLDGNSCQCGDYPNRQAKVPDCIKLTKELISSVDWLPPTCGYRLVDEGKDLPWWHPVVSGSTDTVHQAGISVRGRVAGVEDQIEVENFPDYMVSWPMRVPKLARGTRAPGTAIKGKKVAKGK